MTDQGSDSEILDIGGRPYRLGFHKADWFSISKEATLEDRERVFRRENLMSEASTLFHYTSIGGMFGIVESGGFWASDNRFMNDSEERIHGMSFVLELIGRYQQRRRTCPNFKNMLAESVRLVKNTERYFYLVTCFSDAGDSLEQWRGYGKAGGVAIRLGTHSPSGCKYISAGPDLILKKVLYEDLTKAQMILSILRRYEKEYLIDRQVMATCWPDNHDQNYAESIANRLTFASLVFKDRAFRAERETRYIISAGNADRFGGLKFRTTGIGVVGYINTGSGQVGNLPISEIVVGPSPYAAVTLESIRTYLKERGYNDVEVKLSKVPFREY